MPLPTIYWDNHYSGNANDYFTVSFYGTQVKLIGSKDINYGCAAVSIDGGPETTIDCYRTTRAGQQTLYQSPVLARGQHTLKVRVTGNKSFLATGTVINADRVDVID